MHCCFCNGSWEGLGVVEHERVRGHSRESAGQHFTVWRCPSCFSLHSLEQVDLGYYYARYPLKEHRLDFVMRRAYGNRLALLKKVGLRPDHYILDYGCGAGLFVRYLLDQGYRNAAGYDRYVPDFSDDAVLQRKNDFVTCYDVIEHFEDPRLCMQELREATKPGGFTIIGTPNAKRTDLSKQARFMVELSQPYHRHILSEDAMMRLASQSGCQLQMITHRFYLDTLFPFVNTRFAWSYLRRMGNHLDTAAEGLRISNVLSSPKLLFFAFFGYFFPVRSNFVAVFRNTARAG